MRVRTLCPLCLDELPDNYPFDHVAIDRILAGKQRPADRAERDEAIRVGIRRGMTITQLAQLFHCSCDTVTVTARGIPRRQLYRQRAVAA
jgi:hypothetical protein